MTTQGVTIDPKRCDGCWACIRSCPSGALEARVVGPVAEISWNAGRCLFCRRCEAVCPKEAVGRAPLEGAVRTAASPRLLVRLGAWLCPQCGAPFGAGPRRSYDEIAVEVGAGGRLALCARCRQREAFRAELCGKGEGDSC